MKCVGCHYKRREPYSMRVICTNRPEPPTTYEFFFCTFFNSLKGQSGGCTFVDDGGRINRW